MLSAGRMGRKLARLLRRVLGVLGRAVLFAVLTVAVAEGALRLASLFARTRDTAWRPGATRRVLCVGDSHTYGAGVAAEDAYPQQLQALLDEQTPGAYSVANFGLPGMSSTQVRNRLPGLIAELRPDVVVEWSGANDAWNRGEEESPRGWRDHVRAFVSGLRLTRFVRVWLYRQHLETDIAGQPFGDRPHFEHDQTIPGRLKTTVDWGGAVERLEYPWGKPPDDDAAPLTTANVAAMADIARVRGVGLIAVTYPLEAWPNIIALNRALRELAARSALPLVDGPRALERVPQKERVWVFHTHPGRAIYREIARDVAAQVRVLAPAGERH